MGRDGPPPSRGSAATQASARGGARQLPTRGRIPQPSVRGRACGGGAVQTAAFVLTGQPRTFVTPEAHHSIRRAIADFGAHAYTFFYLTDDDAGSSWGGAPLSSDAARVHAAMAHLSPKYVYYGKFNGSELEDVRQRCPRVPEERSYGNKPFTATFWETHEKQRRCFAEVEAFERTHRMEFDWVVRLRPDVWFFGSPAMPAHCSLRPDALTFPAGVVACRGARASTPCDNDHLAFMPRRYAAAFFSIAAAATSCHGLAQLARYRNVGQHYVLARLLEAGVPIGHPSPLVPYTLLRACSSAPNANTYAECLRWQSWEPYAGLKYDNGTWLPGVEATRTEMMRLGALCAREARATFVAQQTARSWSGMGVHHVTNCAAPPRGNQSTVSLSGRGDVGAERAVHVGHRTIALPAARGVNSSAHHHRHHQQPPAARPAGA